MSGTVLGVSYESANLQGKPVTSQVHTQPLPCDVTRPAKMHSERKFLFFITWNEAKHLINDEMITF